MEGIGRLAKHHGDSLWRYKALMAAANRFLVTNQPDKYTPLYKAVYDSFPDQAAAASSHWHVVWAAYIRRTRDARELLREHLRRYPGHPSASAALYFLGRLAEIEHDYAAARAFYTRLAAQFPNYYYGILARGRMSQPVVASAGAFREDFRNSCGRSHSRPHSRQSARRTRRRTRPLRIARAAAGVRRTCPIWRRPSCVSARGHGGQPYLLAMELARSRRRPMSGCTASRARRRTTFPCRSKMRRRPSGNCCSRCRSRRIWSPAPASRISILIWWPR